MKTEMVNDKRKLFSLLSLNKQIILDFGVKNLGLFGSFVRNEQDRKSDVDLIVEFEDGKKTFKNFIGLAYYLEDILGRKVELLTMQSISPYLKPHIMKQVEYVPFTA